MDELTPEALPSTSVRRPATALACPTVLVLEDDNTTRLILVAALENAGYRVLQAGRASEARRILAQEKPELLIVDGLLPDGTGLDFLTELRSQKHPAKAIFLSSFFRDHHTFTKLRGNLGVGDVLYKPVTPQKLLASVSKLLIAHGTASQS